jgi:hypothetical protein
MTEQQSDPGQPPKGQDSIDAGNIGSSATAMGDLFKPGTGFWSLGASLTQTLFEGGTLIHRKRARRMPLLIKREPCIDRRC